MVISCMIKFYKVLDHRNPIYHDGPNFLCEPLVDYPMEYGFSTIEYIDRFYDNGLCLAEIIIPLNCQSKQLSTYIWIADKIIVGAKYSLLDPTTYYRFSLNMSSNINLIDLASACGEIWFLQSWIVPRRPDLPYSETAIDHASALGNSQVLDWWLKSGLKLKYSTEAMDLASKNGHTFILEWWLKSGLELKYSTAAMIGASISGHLFTLDWWANHEIPLKYHRQVINHGHVPVLEWWKKMDSALFTNLENLVDTVSMNGHIGALDWYQKNYPHEFTYSIRAIDWASAHGYVYILEWWSASGLELLYTNLAMDLASEYGRLDVLEWWAKSRLVLKYSEKSMDGASANGHVHILEWWKNFSAGTIIYHTKNQLMRPNAVSWWKHYDQEQAEIRKNRIRYLTNFTYYGIE